MLIIGDIHGDIVKYGRLIKRSRSSLQVGDLGLGFPDRDGARMTNLFRAWDAKNHEHHKVLRGNHDNPNVFAGLKSYLGDWGYLPDQDLFFVSGAYSIDRQWRTAGLDWWPEEEMSMDKLQEVVEEFGRCKPRFMVTHDCPMVIYQFLCNHIHHNNTAMALDLMFGLHQPEKWYFGHHHQTKEIFHPDGTIFRCLAEHETFEDHDIPDF